ncbi:hypothetical protein [Algoriphagus sp.]|uniref:hypothetical protein n=1 Tax=Algoriphagus sp. TaxID=1872435 RepID=UPI0025EB0D38|nr:hypothetical protein [Algoriphagus sp.]
MKKYIFLIFLVLVSYSCQENEKPRAGFGEVSITGVQLINGTPSIENENTWIHQFDNSLDLNFINEEGQSFQLTINPNDFSKPYTIELAFGNYTFSGEQFAGDISEYLPIKIEGSFNLSQEKQTINLPANTEYGLITISQSQTSQKPIFISDPSSIFFEKENVFYSYGKDGFKTSVEISIDAPSNKFKTITQFTRFQHLAKQIVKKDESATDNFELVDFIILKETILLDQDNKPLNLMPSIIDELDISMNESSGLAYIENRLFSINDEDNSAKIQEVDPLNGSLIREIVVENAINSDWEDLAQSDTHLFIGDFGNNRGTRKNLNILKISIQDLLSSSSVEAEKIEFSFADQFDFSGSVETNNFDCESFFFLDNQLHLFTKNWENNKTRHYLVQLDKPLQEILPIEEFDSKGLITGADISHDGKNIVLLGYENIGIASRSFIWLISEFSGNEFFSGTKRKTLLGSPSILSQTEGIIFRNHSEIFISGEKINFSGLEIPSKLSEINLAGLF